MRRALIERIVAAVDGLPGDRRVLVGIDGVDGAGKSVFGDELAAAIRRPVVRASIDAFHHPRADRYRRGRDDPLGYYLDSFDLALVRRVLLDPLRCGDGRYRAAAFDHRADAPVDAPVEQAPPDAVLVFDGIFLHRPELRDCWDLSVFLRIDEATSVGRCAERDGPYEGRRYVDGQRHYLRLCDPERRATIVVDNTRFEHPEVVRWT